MLLVAATTVTIVAQKKMIIANSFATNVGALYVRDVLAKRKANTTSLHVTNAQHAKMDIIYVLFAVVEVTGAVDNADYRKALT